MNKIDELDKILNKYYSSFISKQYIPENDELDILMQVFNIDPLMKRKNKQYWGRELGKCWEALIIETCKECESFEPALKVGNDEPCDLRIAGYAIDTKYRIGSGDSGTLKKFKQYSTLLKDYGYKLVLLFLREDNLPAAINACSAGGWDILIGKQSFDFIKKLTGIDLERYLRDRMNAFPVVK